MQIDELIFKKEENIKTKEEKEKLELIKDIIKEDEWVFKNSMEVVIGILEFLDIEEDKILEMYTSLMSPINFSKTHPKERL